MNTFRSLFAAAVLALASLPVNAALIVYTERGEWETAVSGLIQTEVFNNAIANAVSIPFDSGIVSAAAPANEDRLLNAVGPLPTPPFPDADPFKLDAYYGRTGGTGGSEKITWAFPDSVFPD